jgi:hypothetical protein
LSQRLTVPPEEGQQRRDASRCGFIVCKVELSINGKASMK